MWREDGLVRPLFLMDIGGPLNPYDAPWCTQRKPPGYTFHELTPSGGITYRVALSRDHGRELLKVAESFDLAWASTWLHDAKPQLGRHLAHRVEPHLGLAPADFDVLMAFAEQFHAR
jgi:hypothetical protein